MDALISKPAKVADVKEGMKGVFEEWKKEKNGYDRVLWKE